MANSKMSFEISRASVKIVVGQLETFAPNNMFVKVAKMKADEILEKFPELVFRITIEGLKH